VRRKIILLPEALLDAENAYQWYQEQDAGLGEEFLRCLEAAYAKIGESPEHYPIRFDSFRRFLIRRFPYAVYFEHDETNVWVYYIFHCSQDPDRLRGRFKSP
jgi:plasmid stabilization system protein ParE